MVIYEFGTKYITKEYLCSKEYEEYMETHLENGEDRYNQGESLLVSESFGWRHANMCHVYVWKWLCTYQYRHLIMDYIFSDKIGIDFGGGLGPVGGNTRIIDILPEFDNIDDVAENSLDYIFTSHTLEHVWNLDETLIKLRSKLKDDGIMIAIVPCYKCVRWRACNYDTGINKHLWTFTLEDDEFIRIDEKIEKAGFKINKVEYCWDNSIFVLCDK
jgi:SAM-dependent methyltransferase